MAFSGGDPQKIGAGGTALRHRAEQVRGRRSGVRAAGAAMLAGAGGSAVTPAASRFVAAYSACLADLGDQLRALGTLAESTGEDLEVVGSAR